MKIDSNIKKIINELTKNMSTFDTVAIKFYIKDRRVATEYVGGTKDVYKAFLKEVFKRSLFEDKMVSEVKTLPYHRAKVTLTTPEELEEEFECELPFFCKAQPRLKRIYQCGNLYVSELTQSGTFEFDTDINAAFNFIDWSYEDLLYHEFFRNQTGNFFTG
ncbi:hypothetical protein [Holzapfeliella sp. JNUCC 80]